MAELPLIDPDTIVTDAAYAMLSGRAEKGGSAEITYSHGPHLRISMSVTGRTLRVTREPGGAIEGDLDTATPAALQALATAARNASSGVPSSDLL